MADIPDRINSRNSTVSPSVAGKRPAGKLREQPRVPGFPGISMIDHSAGDELTLVQ